MDNLPNYFLADLPPEARLSGDMIQEACQTLRQNRQRYLTSRSTASLIQTIAEVAADWLRPDYPFRQLALEASPDTSGFPPEILAVGLNHLFAQLTPENLEALLVQDLGNPKRLREFSASRREGAESRLAHVKGPELLVHIAAGHIPNPLVLDLVTGLLLHSAQFVKCPTGGAFLPKLFAHSLYEADPKLGACIELAAWPGGKHELEAVLFSEADCVSATGSDETLADIRAKVPMSARFISHGHRISFGFIARECLGRDLSETVKRAATDIVAWNQLGCLSPHLFYVERGGRTSVEDFAQHLAEELSRLETLQPRGLISAKAAADIATRRGFYQVRAAHDQETRLWTSPNSTAWTVVCEADSRFQGSCLNRFVYVKGVTDLNDALRGADTVRRHVSTVGLAAEESRAASLAASLANWGASRICPLGQMQRPPLPWRHDGRPPIGDLVVWSDWELEEDSL